MERYYRCRRIGEWPDRPFRRAELVALQASARVVARTAGRYVVLSEHLADVVRGHGTRAPIDVVPAYGVDTDVFAPASAPREQLRDEIDLPRDDPIVFFSSRVAPEKDADTLLAALARLEAGGGAPWLLSCAREHKLLRERARAAGVEHRLIARDMLDPGPELARHLQACDVVVQASREEGLGFAPLEALAAGAPVIATAVGGLRETIRDGATGWTYDVGDDARLADVIAEVLADSDEARRRTTAGAAFVRERYAPGPLFDRLVELAARRRR
jgi:glycosyltransferase involved in cell wall biosynthesis